MNAGWGAKIKHFLHLDGGDRKANKTEKSAPTAAEEKTISASQAAINASSDDLKSGGKLQNLPPLQQVTNDARAAPIKKVAKGFFARLFGSKTVSEKISDSNTRISQLIKRADANMARGSKIQYEQNVIYENPNINVAKLKRNPYSFHAWNQLHFKRTGDKLIENATSISKEIADLNKLKKEADTAELQQINDSIDKLQGILNTIIEKLSERERREHKTEANFGSLDKAIRYARDTDMLSPDTSDKTTRFTSGALRTLGRLRRREKLDASDLAGLQEAKEGLRAIRQKLIDRPEIGFLKKDNAAFVVDRVRLKDPKLNPSGITPNQVVLPEDYDRVLALIDSVVIKSLEAEIPATLKAFEKEMRSIKESIIKDLQSDGLSFDPKRQAKTIQSFMQLEHIVAKMNQFKEFGTQNDFKNVRRLVDEADSFVRARNMGAIVNHPDYTRYLETRAFRLNGLDGLQRIENKVFNLDQLKRLEKYKEKILKQQPFSDEEYRGLVELRKVFDFDSFNDREALKEDYSKAKLFLRTPNEKKMDAFTTSIILASKAQSYTTTYTSNEIKTLMNDPNFVEFPSRISTEDLMPLMKSFLRECDFFPSRSTEYNLFMEGRNLNGAVDAMPLEKRALLGKFMVCVDELIKKNPNIPEELVGAFVSKVTVQELESEQRVEFWAQNNMLKNFNQLVNARQQLFAEEFKDWMDLRTAIVKI